MIAPSTSKSKQSKKSPSDSAASQGELQRFLLNALRLWWKVVIPVGTVMALAAIAIVYFTFQPQFEAKTLLWIDQEEPYLVHRDWSGERDFVRNQLGMIQSSLVLAPIVSQPDIANLPELVSRPSAVEALASMMTVEKAFGSEHFYVKCTYHDPSVAARIVNAVTKRYLLLTEKYQSDRSNQLIQILDDEQDASERRVRLLRDNVRQMTIDQTGKDPYAITLESDDGTQATAQLAAQLTQVRIDQFVINAHREALEDSYAESPIEVTDEMVDRHLKQQGRSLVRLDRRRDAREELHAMLAKERSEKLAELENQLFSSRVRQKVLEQSFEDEVEQAKEVSGETLELEVQRQELDRANFVLDQIAERVFLLRTEQRAPARVGLVEEAAVPNRPIERVPYTRMGMAGSAGMLLPFLLACLWEYRVQRVGNSEQLEQSLELSVIGEIASFRRAPTTPFMGGRLTNELRNFEESVDSFRSLLLLADDLHERQVVAVTSAASGEGKTTVATQLAFSIARATAEPTLLIDGDMRAPRVHSMLGIPNEAGFAQCLDQEVSIAEAIDEESFEGLHVLTAGRLSKSPHQLLRIDYLQALLKEARQDYKYIVMDSPPVLAAGETLAVARAADATVVCTMRDFSRHSLVHRAHARLVAAGANVLGCVLSGVSPKLYGYRYGRYSYK